MPQPHRSPCPIACSLDLLGDKWTLLIVRDLFLGRRYFKEFLAAPEGIASNILADRIKRLTSAGLVQINDDSATLGRPIYTLSPKGQALLPLVNALKDWGLRYIDGSAAKLQPKPQG